MCTKKKPQKQKPDKAEKLLFFLGAFTFKSQRFNYEM